MIIFIIIVSVLIIPDLIMMFYIFSLKNSLAKSKDIRNEVFKGGNIMTREQINKDVDKIFEEEKIND